MGEQEILETVKRFHDSLPKFPDGRIDYRKSDVAPVITVFVRCGDEILLLKRSERVRTYRGKWNSVAGYLDELKPIREKVLEELEQELGIDRNEVVSVHMGKPYELVDSDIKKTWIIHPVMVDLVRKPEIKIDWEHSEYRWIRPEELKSLTHLPN